MLAAPESNQRINAMLGCLHLGCSWNREKSLLQKSLAKLADENAQSKHQHETRNKVIDAIT